MQKRRSPWFVTTRNGVPKGLPYYLLGYSSQLPQLGGSGRYGDIALALNGIDDVQQRFAHFKPKVAISHTAQYSTNELLLQNLH